MRGGRTGRGSRMGPCSSTYRGSSRLSSASSPMGIAGRARRQTSVRGRGVPVRGLPAGGRGLGGVSRGGETNLRARSRVPAGAWESASPHPTDTPGLGDEPKLTAATARRRRHQERRIGKPDRLRPNGITENASVCRAGAGCTCHLGCFGRLHEWHVDLEGTVTMEKLGSYPTCLSLQTNPDLRAIRRLHRWPQRCTPRKRLHQLLVL
jgi:hypothetical protein